MAYSLIALGDLDMNQVDNLGILILHRILYQLDNQLMIKFKVIFAASPQNVFFFTVFGGNIGFTELFSNKLCYLL